MLDRGDLRRATRDHSAVQPIIRGQSCCADGYIVDGGLSGISVPVVDNVGGRKDDAIGHASGSAEGRRILSPSGAQFVDGVVVPEEQIFQLTLTYNKELTHCHVAEGVTIGT